MKSYPKTNDKNPRLVFVLSHPSGLRYVFTALDLHAFQLQYKERPLQMAVYGKCVTTIEKAPPPDENTIWGRMARGLRGR